MRSDLMTNPPQFLDPLLAAYNSFLSPSRPGASKSQTR